MSRNQKMSVRFASAVTQNLPDISAEKMKWLMEHPKILRMFLSSISSRKFFEEMRARIDKHQTSEPHSDCDCCW
jgi:hypothetical protein